MTIKEAMKLGIRAVRKDAWEFKDDRLELESLGNGYGPWGKLVSPSAVESIQRRETTILLAGDSADDWVEYLAHAK
jgi:hypothetical protein